jgi:hypothetical protein
MSAQFNVGDIAIGQNFVLATDFNGMEATIVGPLEMRGGFDCGTGEWVETLCYEVEWANGDFSQQEPFYLRRRQPPTTGEQSIIAMFDTPMVDRRRPVTAWQAQYDTAQALMKMGVRVRPGKWPVEVV